MGMYEILSPIFRLLPEVPRPKRKLSVRERLFWTGIVLVLYFVMSQIPLYGIEWSGSQFQPLLFFQVVMASKRGTLMELGIGPIVTAGIIWQLLVGSKIIPIDVTTKEGRALFTGTQKILAILFAAFEASAYIFGGAYGRLTSYQATLIFAQLMIVSIIILLMDEMLQRGWGFGSAISLFIAAGVAQQIFWEMLAPIPLGDGLMVGVIPSVIHASFQYFATGNGTLLSRSIMRASGYPDLIGFIAMIGFVLLLTVLESIRVEIPVVATRYGSYRSRIPLKFLYVSNLPVILVSALYADLIIFTQSLWPRINPGNTNPWLNMIAMYNYTGGTYQPIGGLVYYIYPPRSLTVAMADPLRTLTSAATFILLSVLFAVAWVMTSGMDPESQAEQLVKSELQVPGFRKSKKVLTAVFKRYVWPLTIISGLLVGIIGVVSDIVGALGSGIGILLMVGILVQYYTLLAREQALEMYPMLAKIIGER